MNKTLPVIILFDGDENYQTVVDLILYNMGGQLSGFASTIESARELLAKIDSKQLKPDIAIVSSFIGNTHQDGSKLAKKMREISPQTKIIAYSHLEDEDWGDELALKATQDNSQSLISSLEKLTKIIFKGTNVIE